MILVPVSSQCHSFIKSALEAIIYNHKLAFIAVHIRRERVEAVGDDEERGNREELDTTETLQVRDITTDRGRTQLLALSVRQGGPETERQRIRAGHYLLFGFR